MRRFVPKREIMGRGPWPTTKYIDSNCSRRDRRPEIKFSVYAVLHLNRVKPYEHIIILKIYSDSF